MKNKKKLLVLSIIAVVFGLLLFFFHRNRIREETSLETSQEIVVNKGDIFDAKKILIQQMGN